MSISLYTATTVAAADAGGANADAALTRLRQRLMVNRFNNAPVTDNASSINGVTGGAGTAVNINTATNVTTAGFYVFINRTITLGSSGTLRAAAAGVHFAFFNCRIETDSDQGTVTNAPISTNQNLHTGSPTSGAVSAGQTATRSVNYYGCWYTQESSSGSVFHFFTDFFDSTMESVVDRTFIPTTFTGARIINGTYRGNANIATSLLSPYRSPEVLEGMVLSAMSYEMPQVGLTQLIQVNPQLLNPFFPQKYRVNIPNGNGAIIHNIGYSSPASNVTDDTITTDNAGDAYYFSPGGIQTGGPINYYPWTMRCFSDVAQTQAVENVRFRLASSVPLNNGAFVLNTVTANTIDTTINSLSSGSSVNAQSFATVARNTITDYLTDANGRPFLTGARYSRDGGSSFVNNTWFDWLRFNIRNTTTNVNALGTAFSNTDAPDNVIFAPVQMVAWDRYNYFAASLEGRSYTNDIHFEEDVRNGVIGDANGPQPSEAVSGTTQNLIGPARTTIVATSEANAETAFGTTVSNKSWQTIYDKLVRDWSTYATDQFFEITNNQLVIPHTVAISNSNSDISYGPSLLGLTRISGISAPAAGDVVTGISAPTIQGDITALPSGTSIAGAFTDTNSGAVRAYNFDGVDVSGLTFNANGSGDITIAGVTMDAFAAFNDTGTGNVTFLAAPVSNTIQIDRTRNGYYAIVTRISGTETVVRGPARISTFTDFTFNSTTFPNILDEVEVYVKYDSVTSGLGAPEFFQEFRSTFFLDRNNDGRIFNIEVPAPVSTALVGDATDGLPANVGITETYNDALAPNEVLLTITNTTSNDPLNIAQAAGLTLAATIGNTEQYFESWFRNRATTFDPIFTYGQNEVINWDNRRITFASGDETADATPFRVQHVVQNWSSTPDTGTFALSRTGAGEVSPQISGAASIGTVIQAIDGSNTASSVEDIKNFAGNQSTNPLLVNPQGGFDRSVDYRNNINRS